MIQKYNLIIASLLLTIPPCIVASQRFTSNKAQKQFPNALDSLKKEITNKIEALAPVKSDIAALAKAHQAFTSRLKSKNAELKKYLEVIKTSNPEYYHYMLPGNRVVSALQEVRNFLIDKVNALETQLKSRQRELSALEQQSQYIDIEWIKKNQHLPLAKRLKTIRNGDIISKEKGYKLNKRDLNKMANAIRYNRGIDDTSRLQMSNTDEKAIDRSVSWFEQNNPGKPDTYITQ